MPTTEGYNGAFTGTQIDEAIGQVRNKNLSADGVKFTDGETFQQKYDSGELTGPPGADGAKGDKGDTGDTGATGPAGADGEDGGYYKPAVDTSGNLTWTASKGGMPAISGQNIRGPQGDQGPAGADGAQGEQGPAGADGAAATIAVGTVTTGEPGSSASVVNAGTSNAAVLNFTIPRGATGEQGPKGDTGPAGADGAQGPAGADGTDGKSAYQSATEAGYTGTEAEFNAALKTLDGAPFLPLAGGLMNSGAGIYWASADQESGAVISFYDSGKGALSFNTSGALNFVGETSVTFAGNMAEFSVSSTNFYKSRLSNIGTPTASTDAATKGYVDGLIGDINTLLDTINGEAV